MFVAGVPDPLVIVPASPALGLLKAVRDESHRFAKAYHTQLRNRRQKKSLLDEIPGVGPARKRKLLQVFGSVAEIEQTPEADLTAVVGPALAAAIREFFVQRAAGQQTGDPSLSRRLKKTKKVRGGD
jgi:excinuclease ABC subunit C